MNGASFEVTYNIFVRLTFEKTYDAMLTTPIEPDDILAGEILWAVSRACVYGGCFFLVLLLFGLTPLPSSLLVLAVIPLTGLLFASIGMAFSLKITTINLFSFFHAFSYAVVFVFRCIFSAEEEDYHQAGYGLPKRSRCFIPFAWREARSPGRYPASILWDVGSYWQVSSLLFLSRTAKRAPAANELIAQPAKGTAPGVPARMKRPGC